MFKKHASKETRVSAALLSEHMTPLTHSVAARLVPSIALCLRSKDSYGRQSVTCLGLLRCVVERAAVTSHVSACCAPLLFQIDDHILLPLIILRYYCLVHRNVA